MQRQVVREQDQRCAFALSFAVKGGLYVVSSCIPREEVRLINLPRGATEICVLSLCLLVAKPSVCLVGCLSCSTIYKEYLSCRHSPRI